MLWTVPALLAGIGLGAALTAWRAERRRSVAESEDSRDTQIRELLAALKIARKDAGRAREEMAQATSDAAELTRKLESLDKDLAAARREQDESRALLEAEIAEKARLQEALEQSRRSCEALKTRVQELELQLRAGESADLLDPALQMR